MLDLPINNFRLSSPFGRRRGFDQTGLSLRPDYWIDATNGDDGNDGSEGSPWATLSKIEQSILTSGETTIVRVKSGTYDTADDYVEVSNPPLNSDLRIVYEVGCIMDGTAANAISPKGGHEFSGTNTYETVIYGNGLQVNNYAEPTGYSPNGFGNRGTHRLWVYNAHTDNCDDGFSCHEDAEMRIFDCSAFNSDKLDLVHVDNTKTFHYRCNFGTTRNDSPETAIFEDCSIGIPASNSNFLRCRIGDEDTSSSGNSGPDNTVFDKCFVNMAYDTNGEITLTKCYGLLSFRQRDGGSLTMKNCVISGPATGKSAIFYSNFDYGSGSPHIIEDNIFETASAAEFMAYDSINAGYLASAGSRWHNNILSGSAAFDADLIAADAGGTVIVDNVTADALIGDADTLDPDDYGYGAGSPAIGAATDGGNCGFAVGEVSPPSL